MSRYSDPRVKSWKCNDCQGVFKPRPPDYSCPYCHSNSTVPVGLQEQIAQRKEQEKARYYDEADPERFCPMCGGVMRFGQLVETNPIKENFFYGRRIYWATHKGRDVPLDAYLCPDCGYVVLYASDLEKHRGNILKSPTRKIS